MENLHCERAAAHSRSNRCIKDRTVDRSISTDLSQLTARPIRHSPRHAPSCPAPTPKIRSKRRRNIHTRRLQSVFRLNCPPAHRHFDGRSVSRFAHSSITGPRRRLALGAGTRPRSAETKPEPPTQVSSTPNGLLPGRSEGFKQAFEGYLAGWGGLWVVTQSRRG